MSRIRAGIARATGLATTAAAYVAGAVLVALMLLTTADVAGRYFLNAPLYGVFDLTHFAVLIMVFLGLAYCGLRGGHIVIELLYHRLPAAARQPLRRAINLLGCALFATIAWRTAVQSIDVRAFGEASQLLAVPHFPFYWVVSAGSALFALLMALRVVEPEPEGDEVQ